MDFFVVVRLHDFASCFSQTTKEQFCSLNLCLPYVANCPRIFRVVELNILCLLQMWKNMVWDLWSEKTRQMVAGINELHFSFFSDWHDLSFPFAYVCGMRKSAAR